MNDLRTLTPEQKQALLRAAVRRRPSAANASDLPPCRSTRV